MVPTTQTRGRNRLGVVSILLGALGLAFGPGAVEASQRLSEITLRDAVIGIAAGSTMFGVLSLYLSRRARLRHVRTLGRSGGRGAALAGRILGTLALALGVGAGIALLVYALLVIQSR
jgi:DNA-binding transcriptional regulator LsrR (DeoR family)